MTSRRLARWAGLLVVGLVVALQFVPNGAPRRNPGITAEPILDADVRALAERACFDCHSNRTDWPWYSAVAPTRWMVSHDVTSARSALNFSEFDRPQPKAERAAEAVLAETMPPARYLAVHPVARLSPAERETLARRLTALRERTDERWGGGAAGAGAAE